MSSFCLHFSLLLFFFFNAPATTEIYTLSLHDALPIFLAATLAISGCLTFRERRATSVSAAPANGVVFVDRKSTRLNSSHTVISYAVFCLKKKKHQKKVRST